MTLIRFQHRVDGVLTNAVGVRLSSPDESYGLKRIDTGVTLVPDDTAFTNPSVGVYEYTLVDPVPTPKYDYWVEVEDPVGVYSHFNRVQQGGVDVVLGIRTLEFSVIENGEVVDLASVPRFSSPTSGYGARRLDTGAIVISDGTAYNEVGAGLYQYELGDVADGLVYQYYIEVLHNGISYYIPRTTAVTNSATLAIGRYTDSLKIEKQFGFENLHKWMAIDTADSAVDYAMRLYEFIQGAEAYIDMTIGSNGIVKSMPDETSQIVTDIATALAAVRCYESRGVTDYNPNTGQVQHRLAYQKKEALSLLGKISSGRIKVPGSTLAVSQPFAGYQEYEDTYENVQADTGFSS